LLRRNNQEPEILDFDKHLDLIDERANTIFDERVKTLLREHRSETLGTGINISDKIQVELNEKITGTNRQYKLTAAMKFEMFEDYLRSELRTKGLEYILTGANLEQVSENKLEGDKDKVRDVIINHIEMKYYSKILEIKEPVEIMKKLKEYKKLEIRTTSMTAKRELFSLKFNPKKEREAEFCDRFEEKVREYESLPDSEKLTEKDKRDCFMSAIVQVVPSATILNSLHRQQTGKNANFEALKDHFLHS
jgi:hypothetical protein